MRHNENPRGSRLRALERNILKYRALEMVLALFYTEDLRETVIGCIQASDEFKLAADGKTPPEPRIPPGTNRALQKALNIFIADGILSADEKREIERLIDFRNDIAHRLHELTVDLNPTQYAKSFTQFLRKEKPGYDYQAIERLRGLRRMISERATSRYVWRLSMAPLLFEPAEKALILELKRLRHRVERQLLERKLSNAKLKEELRLDGSGLTDERHPYHPLNRYESGNLTARGVEICYRLFDSGKSPLAVAYLMRVSLKAATRRQKMWVAVGGSGREKRDLRSMKMRKFYRTYD
ncbi:hypothetical protein AB7828_29525 [Tardiphaga sp. 215_C5_N2_1]|uniref:hypothetical protein n=1 Tax=Tardiphaga sp. 215_C5_N2_1 TaxID=3240774 RepID=UPI003F8C843F